MDRHIDIFIKNYTNAILQGEAAIFAGAGLSQTSGFVNWKDLLQNIAHELKLDIDKENDFISLAQYYLNESGGNRYSINKEILDQFARSGMQNATLNIITSLPIDTFWTTNYDHLIEESLSNVYKKIVDVKVRQDDLAANLNDRDAVVYKFHGDTSDVNNAILTKDDYEMFTVSHSLFITALKGDLVSKTFVFVGYGLRDPNFLQVLANIRILIGKSAREHYCFIKELKKEDYEDYKDYDYDLIKQELYIKDIRRYGIKAVMIEEYSDISEIFERVKKRYLSNKIFVAGSCREYGNWKSNDAYVFLNKLGYELIRQRNSVSTGLIEGVGPQLVSGALTRINEDKLRVDKYLTIKTLPLINGNASHLDKDAKKMFQDNMISEVGIVLFLFGNQFYDGVLKSSNGVLEDFRRAKEQGRYIIPVGSTGFASYEILLELEKDPIKYEYLLPYINDLKEEKDIDELVTLILRVINHIQNLN